MSRRGSIAALPTVCALAAPARRDQRRAGPNLVLLGSGMRFCANRLLPVAPRAAIRILRIGFAWQRWRIAIRSARERAADLRALPFFHAPVVDHYGAGRHYLLPSTH